MNEQKLPLPDFYTAICIPILSIALAISSVIGIGCASSGRVAVEGEPVDVAVTVEKSIPYLQISATLAAGSILRFDIKDPEKRSKLANKIWAASKATWTLTNGDIPTPDEFRVYVLAFEGEETTAEYLALVSQLSAIYKTAFPHLTGNPELAAKVLGALAQGAANGAEAYVTVAR
jgi:hypothetical protein